MSKKFGIIIPTYVGDIYLTKALLASIKMFCPQIPICIIKDGDFDISVLVKTYHITHVITKETTKDEFLKENCFNSIYSKMVAFWESPFERFLCIDSDCIVWGDIAKNIEELHEDFIYNSPHEGYTDAIIKAQYFDVKRIFRFLETFNWQGCHFFNAGVFACNKNVFPMQEFITMHKLWAESNDIIFRDQGMLNYWVFHDKEFNRITAKEFPLQRIVGVHTLQELETEFSFEKGFPVIATPIVIHWAGVKPLMMNKGKVFLNPEIYFRKQHLKNIGSLWRFAPELYFYYEEVKAILDLYHKGSVFVYIQRKLTRLFK